MFRRWLELLWILQLATSQSDPTLVAVITKRIMEILIDSKHFNDNGYPLVIWLTFLILLPQIIIQSEKDEISNMINFSDGICFVEEFVQFDKASSDQQML